MNTFIESISPEGIKVNNGFFNAAYTDVLELEVTNYADGVKDTNKKKVFSDLSFCHIMIDSEQNIDFSITTDEPIIEMIFSLSTSTSFTIDNAFHQQPKGHHNVLFYPQVYHNKWQKGVGQEMISILIRPSFAKKYIPYNATFEHFLTNLEADRSAFLGSSSLPITSAMQALLYEIIMSKHQKHFMRMHVESTVLELFMLQMEQIELYFNNGQTKPLSRQNYDQMVRAKTFIENNIHSPLSLADLSSVLGTNEFSLKRSFKQAFGQTMHSFVTEKRMLESKKLLLSEKYNVNEVAHVLGYNDATNFTAAFKKYFGYTPGKILK